MDTVADFITRVRNAGLAKHDKVDVPSSKMREGIARVLKENGYIRSYKVASDGKQGLMRVYLKYGQAGSHAIRKIHRVSTPGKRRYVGSADIPKVRSGYGMCVLSTNKGIMNGTDASAANVGGEVLFNVW